MSVDVLSSPICLPLACHYINTYSCDIHTNRLFDVRTFKSGVTEICRSLENGKRKLMKVGKEVRGEGRVETERMCLLDGYHLEGGVGGSRR